MKALILCIMIMYTAFSFGQKTTAISNEKLGFHSISLMPIGIYEPADRGAVLHLDLTLSKNKHLFSVMSGIGVETPFLIDNLFNITPSDTDDFFQLNLAYGREFKLSEILFWELHAGLGYFLLDNSINGQSNTIGFPISTKLRIMTGKRFSLGLLLQTNLNTEKVIYTGGLILQWNKKKR